MGSSAGNDFRLGISFFSFSVVGFMMCILSFLVYTSGRYKKTAHQAVFDSPSGAHLPFKDQTTVLLRVGWWVSTMKPLLMLSEYRGIIINKKAPERRHSLLCNLFEINQFRTPSKCIIRYITHRNTINRRLNDRC